MTPLYGLAAELASSQTRRGMMVRANKSSSNLTNARRDNEEELRKKFTCASQRRPQGQPGLVEMAAVVERR